MNNITFKEVNNFLNERPAFDRTAGYRKNCVQLTNINRKSRETLAQINGSAGNSLQAKVDLYRKVNHHLKSIQESLNTSKNLWQKIVSVFFFLTDEERELNSMRESFNQEETRASKAERVAWLQKDLEPLAESSGALKFIHFLTKAPTSRPEWRRTIKQSLTDNLTSPEGRLREAYFRVVGNVRLPSSLEGSPNAQSLLSVREDLQSFMEIAAPLVEKDDLAALKKADEQLKFAEKIALDIHAADLLIVYGSDNPERRQARLADIVYSIQSKLGALSPGDELILPGGYANKNQEGVKTISGHAIIYSIKRKENGKLSFTVINTGKGANEHSSPLSTIRSVWDNKFSDRVYDDLDDSRFDHSFFTDLLEQEVAESEQHSMTAIFKILKEKLVDGDNHKVQEGRRHSMQTNGTCTHDSVCCWLESRLSPELFRYLDFYMKRSGLHQLESTAKVSHELSHVTATSFDSNSLSSITLQGVRVIEKIQQIGSKRFASQREEIEKEKATLSETLKRVTQESASLVDEEAILQEQRDPKKLEAKLLGLKGRIKHLEDEVATENALQSSQQSSGLSRIFSTFKSIWGSSSEAAVQLAKAKKERDRCQQQIASLSDPQTQQQLEEQLSAIRLKQQSSGDREGSLQKQRAFLEKLLS